MQSSRVVIESLKDADETAYLAIGPTRISFVDDKQVTLARKPGEFTPNGRLGIAYCHVFFVGQIADPGGNAETCDSVVNLRQEYFRPNRRGLREVSLHMRTSVVWRAVDFPTSV